MSELQQPATAAFTRWPADGVVTYQLAGRVDYAAAFSLYCRALDDLLACETSFVLDLTAVATIEEKALDVLKKLSQRIAEIRGARLVFAHVNADVDALLKRAHFDRVFEIRRATTTSLHPETRHA